MSGPLAAAMAANVGSLFNRLTVLPCDAALPCVQVGSKRLTLVELLCAFRSVPVDLQSLANMLPRLGPR